MCSETSNETTLAATLQAMHLPQGGTIKACQQPFVGVQGE